MDPIFLVCFFVLIFPIRDVICGNRRAADITSQWQHTDDIRQHMLYFLENHDEQRIASDFFAADARKGIPGFIVSPRAPGCLTPLGQFPPSVQ